MPRKALHAGALALLLLPLLLLGGPPAAEPLAAGGNLLANGDYQAAAASYERALVLDRDNAAAWLGLARARAAMGDAPGTTQAYARAAERSRHPVLTQAAANLQAASEDRTAGIGFDRPADRQAYLALSLLARGQPSEARATAEEALSAEPGHFLARFARAAALRLEGEDRAALAELRTLAVAEPNQAAVVVELAHTYADLGDYARADQTVWQMVEQQPDGETLLAAAGFYLERAYQPTLALSLAERAAALLPETAEAQTALGWALHLVGRNEEAANALAKASSLQPGNARVRYQLAAVQEKLGLTAKARESYWGAADLDPLGPTGARARQALLELHRRGYEPQMNTDGER